MKKLTFICFLALAFGAFFQSCSNSKTYADMLADEKKAINRFISKHDIKVISKEEFEKDTITDVSKNEYVQFSNGVYMQIVDRGNGDTIPNRKEILLRMEEFNILSEVDTSISTDTISNVNVDWTVDSFVYNTALSSIKFIVTDTDNGFFPLVYGSSQLTVPAGIIYVLPYLMDRAHVKLIVPSKMGHDIGMQYVYPYHYDIHKIQVR